MCASSCRALRRRCGALLVRPAGAGVSHRGLKRPWMRSRPICRLCDLEFTAVLRSGQAVLDVQEAVLIAAAPGIPRRSQGNRWKESNTSSMPILCRQTCLASADAPGSVPMQIRRKNLQQPSRHSVDFGADISGERTVCARSGDRTQPCWKVGITFDETRRRNFGAQYVITAGR